jgi:hypothetical protein
MKSEFTNLIYGLTPAAGHIAFEGLDKPLTASGVKFIRSILDCLTNAEALV